MISFKIEKSDHEKIEKIIDRAVSIFLIPNEYRLHHTMNLVACHANGNPLDLDALYEFGVLDFFHDLIGINHHLNRENGKLMNCFLPRSSLKVD